MLSIIRKFFLLSHLAPFFYPPSPVNFLLLRFVKFPFCKFSILYFPLWIFSIAGVVEPRDEFSLIGRNRFACREKIYNLFHPATGLTRAFLLPELPFQPFCLFPRFFSTIPPPLFIFSLVFSQANYGIQRCTIELIKFAIHTIPWTRFDSSFRSRPPPLFFFYLAKSQVETERSIRAWKWHALESGASI